MSLYFTSLNRCRRMKLLNSLSLIIIFLLACESNLRAAESPNSRTEWERTVEAAKKEGQLTLYHWGTPLMLDAGAFQKTYPEIKVTIVSAMGIEHMQRIL